MSRIIVLFFIPLQCFAFLDFIGDRAAKVAESLAYTDAVSELLSEVTNDSGIKDGAIDLRRRSDQLRSEANKIQSVSYSTKSVLAGPDLSSKRLDANIRTTTDYIRRVKRLMMHLALLGTDGATAFNTAETNFALNEVQKNQQTMIIQQEDQKLRELEKETHEAKVWDQFSNKQRSYRSTKNKDHGKLK